MDPVQAIKVMMAERGYEQRDLLPVFGTRARVSEVLNYRRRLSINHIRVLVFNFGMDPLVLLGRY